MNRLSAGVVVVRRSGDEIRYLLLRCYRYWDFPKGEVNPGESPLAAAQREVEEETGLRDLAFSWGYGFCETPPYAAGKIARYYLAETAETVVRLGVNPQLGHAEHQEYRWVKRSEARRLLNERVAAVLDWAARIIADGRSSPARRQFGNLFQGTTTPAAGELFDTLLQTANVVVERIVSSARPEPRMYVQAQDEWVLLLEGRALVEMAGKQLELHAGDYLFIPARTPHRVLATTPEPRCVWLAVHIHGIAAAP
jgi:bis(5'-nucleosidyl)-tetraphosphatase